MKLSFHKRWVIAGTAFLFAGGPSSARATDFFVATNGNDASSGTSTNQPFRSIQKAMDLATAGDDVRIRSGDYREQLIVLHSGASNATMMVEGYSNELPSIVG